MNRRSFGAGVVGIGAHMLLSRGDVLWAQSAPQAKELLQTMGMREDDARAHEPFDKYVSMERSERTGGAMWMENVVETAAGRVRFLVAVDGKGLSADRVGQERGRLAAILADPQAFESTEKAEKKDEAHARQLLELLPKAFALENVRAVGDDWRIDFRPDPAYSPSGLEEKVLHGMSGFLLVNQKQMRLHHVEGSMAQDVSIGFGLLATLHAGSHFSSTKEPFNGQWRTVRAVSDFRGRAALFKTIAKNQDVTRSMFQRLDGSPSLQQAVALAELPAA
jgi:hypothetical protein